MVTYGLNVIKAELANHFLLMCPENNRYTVWNETRDECVALRRRKFF